MSRRASGFAWAWTAAALVLPGCSVTREQVLPVIDASAVSLTVDASGPWREKRASSRVTTSEAPPAASGARLGMSTSGARLPASRPLSAPALSSMPTPLPVPRARGTGEPSVRGTSPVKPLAAVARERFLDHPTEIEADHISLYVPPSIAALAHLDARDLSEPTPGRRLASGAASLLCRELTLRAERITLHVRDGSPDIQITARGSVRFVSRQGDQVLREQGLRSLILTNDQIVPLR